MKKYFGLKDYANRNNSQEKHLPYILIIDEINRGEINKILGELFYSIDPGYRGEDGRVKTQYQNLVSEDDIFYQGFYVPKNVYILGTMNDIDRSVESMDFAIRRRFTWREISATDTQKDMLNLLDDSIRQEAIDRMDSLNAAIMNSEYHLGTAYQMGASYFLKLREVTNFEDLWKFHIKGVLYEYLRGQRDIDEKVGKLYKAFCCEPDNV
jgi:5-methylcytosine-specific restriction protein B